MDLLIDNVSHTYGAVAYSDFDTAGKDLSEAQTKLMRLERMLESGGADIFDVKAG